MNHAMDPRCFVSYIHKACFQPTGYTTVGAEALLAMKAESEELAWDQNSATWADVDPSLWAHQKRSQLYHLQLIFPAIIWPQPWQLKDVTEGPDPRYYSLLGSYRYDRCSQQQTH